MLEAGVVRVVRVLHVVSSHGPSRDGTDDQAIHESRQVDFLDIHIVT